MASDPDNTRVPGLLRSVERRGSGDPHSEGSQGGVREAAIALPFDGDTRAYLSITYKQYQ